MNINSVAIYSAFLFFVGHFPSQIFAQDPAEKIDLRSNTPKSKKSGPASKKHSNKNENSTPVSKKLSGSSSASKKSGLRNQKVTVYNRDGSTNNTSPIDLGKQTQYTRGQGGNTALTSTPSSNIITTTSNGTPATSSSNGSTSGSTGNRSTTTSGSTPASGSASVPGSSAASSSAAPPLFCGVQNSIVPGQCNPVQEPVEVFTWKIPTYNGVGGLSDHTLTISKDRWNNFEQPNKACDASNDGELMAVDFGPGIGKKTVMCMSYSPKDAAARIDKVRSTDPNSLPVETARVKDYFEWVKTKEGEKMTGGNFCICSGPSTCSADNIGQVSRQHSCCGEYTCSKFSGYGVYEDPKKATAGPSTAPPNICNNWQDLEVKTCVNGKERGRVSGCLPTGHDNPLLWVAESDGSFSHLTGKDCTAPLADCANWQATEVLSCNNGIEYGTITGCKPPGHDNPLLWVTESNGTFSHRTGRNCGSIGGGPDQIRSPSSDSPGVR